MADENTETEVVTPHLLSDQVTRGEALRDFCNWCWPAGHYNARETGERYYNILAARGGRLDEVIDRNADKTGE